MTETPANRDTIQACGSAVSPKHETSTFRSNRLLLKHTAARWLKLNWLDVVGLALLGGLTLLIHKSPVFFTRTFPIAYDGTGVMVFPELAYPSRGWTVPPWIAGLAAIGLPISFFALSLFRTRSFWDFSAASMGLVWAAGLSCFVGVLLKQTIGGFRPNFLDICKPDITRLAEGNGIGYGNIYYGTEICTSDDGTIKTAITSFPSGHSSISFAGYGFLSLWLNAKLKVLADYKPAFWKVVAVLAPLVAAVWVACTLAVDAAHHWYDIVAGSLIGVAAALVSYRCSFAGVWDWRYNHIPLQPDEPCFYELEGSGKYVKMTLTRKVGWERSAQSLRGPSEDVQDGEQRASSRPNTLDRPSHSFTKVQPMAPNNPGTCRSVENSIV